MKILFVGQESLYLTHIGLISDRGAAQGALGLTGLAVAVEQVALVGVCADNLTIFRNLEALLGAAVSLNFGHDCSSLDVLLFDGLGGQEHKHISSLKLRRLFNVGELCAGLCKPVHGIIAMLGMPHLTAAEPNGDLHLVAFFQKALCVTQLCIKIVGINVERQTDFLDFHHALVLSGFLFPLGLLETELAVIDDLAHRRLCLGRDLHQIQIAGIGFFQRLTGGHNAQLGAIGIDNADFFIADLFVDLQFLVANG